MGKSKRVKEAEVTMREINIQWKTFVTSEVLGKSSHLFFLHSQVLCSETYSGAVGVLTVRSRGDQRTAGGQLGLARCIVATETVSILGPLGVERSRVDGYITAGIG